jgi:hypothetical protein
MRDNRRRRRGSLFGWVSDVLDATHDHADDWVDRVADVEDKMRDAFDDVAEDRYYYNQRGPTGPRYYYYGKPAEREESRSLSDAEERAARPVFDGEVSQLKERINALTDQVEALLQRGTQEETAPRTPSRGVENEPVHGNARAVIVTRTNTTFSQPGMKDKGQVGDKKRVNTKKKN